MSGIRENTALAAFFLCVALLPSFSSAASFESQRFLDDPPAQTNVPGTPEASRQDAAQPQQTNYGTVSGRVLDQTGNGLARTNVQIKSNRESSIQEVQSDEAGRFSFDRVPPGRID